MAVMFPFSGHEEPPTIAMTSQSEQPGSGINQHLSTLGRTLLGPMDFSVSSQFKGSLRCTFPCSG